MLPNLLIAKKILETTIFGGLSVFHPRIIVEFYVLLK
jgi:hypothetical protein